MEELKEKEEIKLCKNEKEEKMRDRGEEKTKIEENIRDGDQTEEGKK